MQKRSQPNHTATKKPPERNDPKAMLSVLSLVQAIRLDLGKAAGTPLAALLWLRYYGTQSKLRRLPPRRFDSLRTGDLAHQARQVRNVICDTPGLRFCGQLCV